MRSAIHHRPALRKQDEFANIISDDTLKLIGCNQQFAGHESVCSENFNALQPGTLNCVQPCCGDAFRFVWKFALSYPAAFGCIRMVSSMHYKVAR
jgi:hypothetical protein